MAIELRNVVKQVDGQTHIYDTTLNLVKGIAGLRIKR